MLKPFRCESWCVEQRKAVFCIKCTISIALFAIAFVVVPHLVCNAEDKAERVYSDKSGKFRIKATITDLNETQVKLLKADGKEVTVEIEKLSEKDQKYLKDAYKKYKAMVGDFPIGTKVEIFSSGGWHPGEILNVQPGKYFIKFDKFSATWNKWVTAKELRLRAQTDEPAQVMKPEPKPSNSTVTPNSATVQGPMSPKPAPSLPDLNKALAAVPSIDLRTAPVASVRFEPDPIPNYGKSLPIPARIAVSGERIGTPMQVRFDSTMQFIAIDPVNFSSAKHTVTVVPMDQSLPKWTILTGTDFAGIADNGQSALFQGGMSTDAYLRVPLTSDKTNLEVSSSDAWIPSSTQVIQQRLLTRNRLLVQTIREVQLWDLDSKTVTARFSAVRGFALSGTGKQAGFLVDQDSVVVVDLGTNEVMYRIQTDDWKPINLSFDPSGTRLAITGIGRGQVHDLSSGAILNSYGLTNGNTGEMGINWIGQRYLVLLGGSIVDLESGLPIWSFPFDRQPLLQFDENTIGVTSGTGTTASVDWVRITPEQLTKASSVDTSNAVSIPRGAVATLDVSGLKHHTQEIKDYFESSLKSLGYTLGPNGMIQIRFSSTIGNSTTVRLKDFMRISKDTQATIVSSTVTRKIVLNGKTIYDLTEEFGEKQLRSTVNIRENESAQDAVTRLTTPSKSLFTSMAIPQAGGIYLPRSKALIGEGTFKDLITKLPK